MLGQQLRGGHSNELVEPRGVANEIRFQDDRSVKAKRPARRFVLGITDLHDYGDTGIIEDLWGELRVPESLSLVSRE